MGILEKEKINDCLHQYYKNHFGERESDEWFDVTAVNVWVFRRDNKIITLKCHILNGEVTEYTEQAVE